MGARDGSSLQSLTLASTLRVLDRLLNGKDTAATCASLSTIRAALRRDDLAEALRQIDREWRCQPAAAEMLAPLYGRLLSLEAVDHGAALRLLQRVNTPDPDTEALVVSALSHLQRTGDAQRRLESALTTYCVAPGSLLDRVAAEVLADPDTEARGWIGVGPALEFIGELKGDEAASGLQIQLDSGTEFTQMVHSSRQGGRRLFRFKLPLTTRDAALRVSSRGLPLLGGYCRMPSTFGLDGRAGEDRGRVSGWVRIGWSPERPVRLCVQDECGHERWLKTSNLAKPGFRWPFQLNLHGAGFRGNRIEILAQLPDGRTQPLPDSPLLLGAAAGLPARATRRLPPWRTEKTHPVRRAAPARAGPVDVIVPVYQGRHEALACLEAVLATIDVHAQLVVVDDASEDSVLAAKLDDLAAAGRVTLLRNPSNLGFVASVNRALALNPAHDVVLLNSDALVFGDWLTRLRAAAYSAVKVGSVTPFSNSGSIANYPRAAEHPISRDDAAALHAFASATHSGVTVDIPVGVGFCLYLRRDCVNEVGEFDAAVFGKGYGEETDFCLRARQRGWAHRLAADVFVYHAGGRSFGERREALLDRSRRLINLRHPGYDRFVAGFLAKNPLQLLRRRLDERRLAAFEGRFALVVTLALRGGVERFVAERCREIRAQGLIPLLLRPAEANDMRCCELWTDALDVPNLRYDVPADLDGMTALLRALPIDNIEIQHFIHLDARVIDAVRSLGVPYDTFVHDYAWICPRVTLIDGSGRYCGEPAVTVCNTCVRRNGSSLGEKISVAELRARSAVWLRGSRNVFAPTRDTAARLRSYFPDLSIEVRAHAAEAAPSTPVPRADRGKSMRVAVLGAIGVHKGYSVLLKCALDAKRRRLPIEFVVIGYTENDAPLLRTGKVFITGGYGEGEAPHLLRRERPDLILLPSVWPETWSYTLDDALGTQLPVVAFDLGAIAERLRARGQGILLPLDCEPRLINERIMQSAQQRSLSKRQRDVMIDSSGETNTNMASNAESLLQESLSASVQLLPLPEGLYLFSVKAASPSPNQVVGQLQLPAMHVGLGPGVRSEQVEFVAGPVTDGAWLFAQDDLLVTKVTGNGVTLLLTSVRAPGGEVLSIQVLRLESSTDLEASAPMAAGAQSGAPSVPRVAPKQVPMLNAANTGALPIQIQAHVRARGDMTFTDAPWAGRVAPGLWIESFAIKPLRGIEAQDIEIKGLTGSGFETPWISDGQMCGTKGMAVPLVGFAVRLKPGAQTANYDCEYSGCFKSGAIVGPLRNGAPCRSTVANDPLEGIQVQIYRRSGASKSAGVHDQPRGARAAQSAQANEGRRPMKVKPGLKRALVAERKQNGAALPKQRPVARRS